MARLAVLVTLLSIGVVVPAVTAAQGAGQVSTGDSVIVAQGEALLMLPPDRAYVQIGAEGRAAKPAEAQKMAATAMTGVQATLKGLGISTEAIRTAAYSVQPQYDYRDGRQTFRDYLARNVIEVRVDDLAKLADVIDAAGTSGAATVSSLRFDLKDRATSERDALRRAVRDATARAQAIAEGAGKTLGPIQRIQEQRTSSASPVFRAESMVAGAGGRGGGTPIEPGEIQVRAQVTLTVSIK